MTVPATDPAAGVIIMMSLVGVVLIAAVTRLRRRRPDMRIGVPLAFAFVVRLLGIVAINATGIGASLRGGDEITFLEFAEQIATHPFGTAYLPHSIYQLQTVIFAMQIKLGFVNESGIRVTQAGIALLGFTFMLAVTYDMGGARAARFASWLLVIEPSSIFFNTEIHKEPLMELAAGLAAFGGSWLWKRLDIRGIVICAIGCAIGIYTRSYAGWFLVGGCMMMTLHAALRNSTRRGTTVSVVYAVAIAAMIGAPTVLSATSGKNLKTLQASQAANATGAGENGGDNLALEQVDISSRGAVITSLPTKLEELILEPYPWQLHDASQAFGCVGTLFAYCILVMLIRYGWLNRGEFFARAGPLLYPLLFEMTAYAVTVGNAGTGFRYRSHLVTLGICVAAILREATRQRRDAPTTDGPGELEEDSVPPRIAAVPA